MTPQELADEVTARPKGHRSSMSADQIRRAAEDADNRGWSEDHAVAALLRAAADYQHEGSEYDLVALLAAVDKVAAAYLGEEPQP